MIGCNCITKVLLADTKVKSKMPLLAVQIDPNFISLNLYENNQLSFSRFASISPEDYDDSDDYVFEAVKENIFRMLQFQRSKAGSDPIENVIFYGDTREYERLTNELEKMGIRTSVISVPPQIHGYENLEFSVYANAIGAMFKRNKENERINLLETDTVNNNRIRSDSSYVMLLILTIVISIAICAVVWLVLTIKNSSVVSEKDTIKAKQDCQLTKDLNAQINMLTQKNKAVSTYLEGVKSAQQAYLSRPYPTAEKYELIENTIHESVKSVFGEEVGENCTFDHTDFYTIDNISYANGVYSLNLKFKGEDLPLKTLPSKIIEDLRSKPEVYYVNYSGYTVSEAEQKEDDTAARRAAALAAAQAAGEGEEGETTETPAAQTVTKNDNTKKETVVNMPLTINMKGDGISLESEED
jgi:type IV pilus assembly protein PilM